VELAAHIPLVPRLRISGDMHPPTHVPSWPAEGRIYLVPFVLNVNKVKNRTYNDDDDNNNNNNY
jgi:hypothetical protein